jgi:hypothetical protein
MQPIETPAARDITAGPKYAKRRPGAAERGKVAKTKTIAFTIDSNSAEVPIIPTTRHEALQTVFKEKTRVGFGNHYQRENAQQPASGSLQSNSTNMAKYPASRVVTVIAASTKYTE